MQQDVIRYIVALELHERDGALDEREAADVLRGEFALAQNAGYLDALAPEDIGFDVLARTPSQDGVTRFTVALGLLERRPELTDEQVAQLLRRAFADALNASFFVRACTDDLVALELLERAAAHDDEQQRRAA